MGEWGVKGMEWMDLLAQMKDAFYLSICLFEKNSFGNSKLNSKDFN